MGTFVGHILPGCGFFLLGVWHLYNIFCGAHKGARTWYPLRGRVRHGELYFILVGAAASIAAELLPDGNYRSVTAHLNNFEHATISLSLLLYAAFALATDLLRIPVPEKLLHAAAGVALSQELLLFHFHSSDHMGLEGQYHRLLQLPIAAGVLMLLIDIVHYNPVVSILRSMSFLIQGAWLVLMGFVLWIPSMVPQGCYIAETDHVDCPMPATLMQAKSLANLEFAWVVSGTLLLTMAAAAVAKHESAAYLHLEDHVKLLDDALSDSQSSDLEMQAVDRLNLPR